jgi:hypothetical protein
MPIPRAAMERYDEASKLDGTGDPHLMQRSQT